MELLKQRIENSVNTGESESEVIHHVTAQFILELMEKGNIPHFLMDTLEQDLQEELLEVYRKLTYGSLTPSDHVIQKAKKLRKSKKASA